MAHGDYNLGKNALNIAEHYVKSKRRQTLSVL
jgi:hypothetical protein